MGLAYFLAESEFAELWRPPLERTSLQIEIKPPTKDTGSLGGAAIRGGDRHVTFYLSKEWPGRQMVPDAQEKLLMLFMTLGEPLADAVELYFLSLRCIPCMRWWWPRLRRVYAGPAGQSARWWDALWQGESSPAVFGDYWKHET